MLSRSCHRCINYALLSPLTVRNPSSAGGKGGGSKSTGGAAGVLVLASPAGTVSASLRPDDDAGSAGPRASVCVPRVLLLGPGLAAPDRAGVGSRRGQLGRVPARLCMDGRLGCALIRARIEGDVACVGGCDARTYWYACACKVTRRRDGGAAPGRRPKDVNEEGEIKCHSIFFFFSLTRRPSMDDPPAPAPAGCPGVSIHDGPPTDPNLREVGTSATWTVGTAKVRERREGERTHAWLRALFNLDPLIFLISFHISRTHTHT